MESSDDKARYAAIPSLFVLVIMVSVGPFGDIIQGSASLVFNAF
jgi:hypothetical protein